MSFEDYAKAFTVEALERTAPDLARDVYVVSLYVDDEEEDPRRPTVEVGFNTEERVANSTDASGLDEARWNFAFWLQNDLGVLAGEADDREGAALRDRWVWDAGLWYSDEQEDADF